MQTTEWIMVPTNETELDLETAQKVVRMIDLQEMSVAEVCELTGWQPSRVRVTSMRARRKLAEQLQRLEGGGKP